MALATEALLYSILYLFPTITDTIIGLGIVGMIGVFTYFGSFYLFGLSEQEKSEVKKIIHLGGTKHIR